MAKKDKKKERTASSDDGEAPSTPWWKNSEVIFKAGVTLAIAIAGFVVNAGLENRRARSAQATLEQQREAGVQRLYTELMTRRQEAESAIRKDMFVNYIQAFLEARADKCGANEIDRRHKRLDQMTLTLELLASNFHESINLKPLFLHMVAEAESVKETIEGPNVAEGDRPELLETTKALRERTLKLSNYVREQQSWVLARSAQSSKLMAIRTEDLVASDELVPLRDYLDVKYGAAHAESDEGEEPTTTVVSDVPSYTDTEGDEAETESLPDPTSVLQSEGNHESGHLLVVDGVARRAWLEAKPGKKDHELEVRLILKEESSSDHPLDVGHEGNTDNEVTLTLSHFDFPMVDNIRLSHNQRCALVLRDYGPKTEIVTVQILVFPGHLASRRLQPYFFDMISEVKAGLKRQGAKVR